MNIRQAKEQVKNAMAAYFERDEFGDHEIPIERQRPIFLMGPPGIGKTAIMQQIAQELGVGLVSYSMTHHTRQSALGLPFITTKNYGGKEYNVSEYTMSEIIASVYDLMEETGVSEGILFLDEINCVSETLAPAMLQFLQFKVFGRHRVPDGWIVITAGNPPEYNDSVREFDIVTWDRLKRIDIEPDYKTWKEYAAETMIHPAVRSYLDIKESDFYRVESGATGRTFVTARGWSDLSDMIRLYEKKGIKVDNELTIQYLQNREVAKSFALYYDLFNKYKSDYQVDRILEGNAGEDIVKRAAEAPFDERLSLLSLLLSALEEKFAGIAADESVMDELLQCAKSIRLKSAGSDPGKAMDEEIEERKSRIEAGKKAGRLSKEDRIVLSRTVAALEEVRGKAKAGDDPEAAMKEHLLAKREALKGAASETSAALENCFAFCEAAFGDDHEMLVLISELTAGKHSAHFISRYGSEGYYRHNEVLSFNERQQAIQREIEQFDELDNYYV